MALTPMGEDLLQDIYLRLSNQKDFERILDENPVGYVFSCLKGEVNSSTSRFHYKYRKDYVREGKEQIVHDLESEYDYTHEEVIVSLENAKRELSISEQKVLDLIYKHGSNMAEISRETGLSYNDIKQLRDNAKEQIEQRLRRYY